jgi:hypothetical protein
LKACLDQVITMPDSTILADSISLNEAVQAAKPEASTAAARLRSTGC